MNDAPIQIRDPKVVRAIREWARETGQPISEAVGEVVLAGGRLNLGDGFACAPAAREGDGLLLKGDDRPRTDVRSVPT
jgi:uncharacterized protein with PIN domain